MQLDGGGKRQLRRADNYRQLRHREAAARSWNTQRFERMMASRLASIDNRLQSLEARIESEVQRRVSAELDELFSGPVISEMINERVNRVVNEEEVEEENEEIESESEASDIETESEFDEEEDDTDLETEETDESEPEEELISSEDEQEEEEEEGPSTSYQLPFEYEAQEYLPNKWEFISTFGTDFTMNHFTDPVRLALNLPPDAELFPRLTLEEIIERDHPTTFDEKKITSKERPHGKNLTDEEFFCLAPCCSSSRLFQAASCPFLPSFVKKRLIDSDSGVMVTRGENGVELITPFKPNPPPMPKRVEEEVEEEEEEEEDPLENREVVEQLMHEHFLPTPHVPSDDYIFGPYLRKVRESTDDVPTDLLRALVRRVNSNLEYSYQSHRELELFAEIDKVQVDEKHGRLSLDQMNI